MEERDWRHLAFNSSTPVINFGNSEGEQMIQIFSNWLRINGVSWASTNQVSKSLVREIRIRGSVRGLPCFPREGR